MCPIEPPDGRRVPTGAFVSIVPARLQRLLSGTEQRWTRMFSALLDHFSKNGEGYVLSALVLALPAGITIAIFTNNPWWLLLSAASFFVFMAG